MKRILLAITLLALLFPIAHPVSAQEVSVDVFYNNLGGGQWIEAEGYGYGWQPDVAINDPNWRPYMDGYWAYTDVGYTWVSYEDFGWATYHYGRWARLTDYGWVWFPGTDLEWGPAWVSWRYGTGVVGWAPLPPRGVGVVYEGQPIGVDVDLVFDIGPAYYNFVDVRYIGEPVLRERIFAPTQNVTFVNQTVNVTNITVNNNVVYNYGPDYNALSAQSSRPIQRLTLERQTNVDARAAVKSGAITKVQGDKLVVAAPAKIQRPAAAAPPPTVKRKVAQPKVEKGWTGVANAAEIKQKMKTEDHKNIPPAPSGGAAAAAAGAGRPAPEGAAASPMTSPARTAVSPSGAAVAPGATAAAASPFEKGKARGRRGQPSPQPAQPAATAAPAFSPAASAPPTGSPAGKHRGPGERPGEHLGATPPTGGPAGTPPTAPSPHGKARGFERGMPTQPPGQPGGAPNETPRGHRGPPATSPTPFSGGPGNRPERPERFTGQGAAQGTNAPEREGGPRRGQPATSPSAYPGAGAGAERHVGAPAGGPGRGQPPPPEGATHRPGAGPAATSPSPGERGHGKAEGKKKPEGSPTPAPY